MKIRLSMCQSNRNKVELTAGLSEREQQCLVEMDQSWLQEPR